MYQRLADAGLLTVDEGRRMVRVETLIGRVLAFRPRVIVADRFRDKAVLDALKARCPIVFRSMRATWSEPTEQIQATRRAALDGALSVVPAARPLVPSRTGGNDRGARRLRQRPADEDGHEQSTPGRPMRGARARLWPDGAATCAAEDADSCRVTIAG